MSDIINKAPHYQNGIEVIDFIEGLNDGETGRGFAVGNIIKYVSRAGCKDDGLQDLLKARYYIDRLIDMEKEQERPLITVETLRKFGHREFGHREIHED